jgi:hypothetical protein
MKGHDPTFHRKYRKGERPLHWVICECEWQSPVSWYAHTSPPNPADAACAAGM